MQEIAWQFYIGKSTAHYVIKETCDVLWAVLSPIVLKPPEGNDWEKIMNGYYNRWNIPNCIGALDGKHCSIQAPKYTGSQYFSYKKSFSIVLMATCDAFYRFILVDIGGYGSDHDSTIFRESGFGKALMQENVLNIPNERNLPETETSFPCYVVADQAFPLHTRIMRPFPGERNELSDIKTIFNYRLSRARRCVENTFGILVQRWRILRKPIVADVSTCEQIIKACVVLHNFVQVSEEDIPISERRYCPTGMVDYVDKDGILHYGTWRDEGVSLTSVNRVGSNNPSRLVQQIRNKLAEYFVTIGAVPWQNRVIRRGSIPEGK